MIEKKRVEVHMQPGFYERLITLAEVAGVGIGEWLLRAGCEKAGVDPSTAIMPKQRAGRRAGRKLKVPK